jgi:hypothetical protein
MDQPIKREVAHFTLPAVEQAYDDMINKEDEYADICARLSWMDEMKAVIIARLSGECNESSEAAKKRYALAHPDYEEHLNELLGQRRIEKKYRLLLENAKTRISAWQTAVKERL